MKKSNSSESHKLDRKTVERNRRIHMKGLCFKLASLIPPAHLPPSKDLVSQLGQLDVAACYIKQLRERVEKLKKVRDQQAIKPSTRTDHGSTAMDHSMMFSLKLPIVELRDFGSTIEVILISDLIKNFMFYEVVSVLCEEGAEVVSASYSTVGDKIFHTIHAQGWCGDYKGLSEIAGTDFLRIVCEDLSETKSCMKSSGINRGGDVF